MAGEQFATRFAERVLAARWPVILATLPLAAVASGGIARLEFSANYRIFTRRLHSALGYLSPNEFERRAAARRPMGAGGHREPTNLEPFRIGRPGIHNHPLGVPSTPLCERDFLPSAIVHPSAGGHSPQPSTESG